MAGPYYTNTKQDGVDFMAEADLEAIEDGFESVDTDIQAKQDSDAFLTSIAALGTAADKMVYTTGVDTAAEADLTAAGRALLDDANAAAQLITLGLTSTAAEVNVLDGIPPTLTATELGYVDGVTSAIQTQLDAKAPLESPALTGNPTAPTQTPGDNSTKIATTAYADAATGSIPNWLIKTAGGYTATSQDKIVGDTTGGAFSITLPASPTVGNFVWIKTTVAASNNLTIARNGSNIDGSAADLVCDLDNYQFCLVYVDATIGWQP